MSKDGTQIRKRGFADVVNRFGGNGFACHIAARLEWDLVCEADDGCAPGVVCPQDAQALEELTQRLKPAP